jgi:magnesium-transporting ATPase (P-type)
MNITTPKQGSVLVNESCLTGESVPVFKGRLEEDKYLDLDDRTLKQHSLFSGTDIVQVHGGRVVAVVLRTGFSTLRGQLIRSILYPKPSGFKFY